MRRFSLAFLAFLLSLGYARASSAFEIGTARSEPCHEKMTLGVLDRFGEGFSGLDDASLGELLQAFVARVEAAGALTAATRGYVEDVTETFGLDRYPFAERFVLASFVAGVRFPDSEGFAIIDFNETRSIHLRDEYQKGHFLRRVSHDYGAGDEMAIRENRDQILAWVEQLREVWSRPGSLIQKVRWTFPFYGEKEVQVFVPAYVFGWIMHLIQDSYAHTIRDERYRILAVANFVEVMLDRYSEVRDGPAHSERLDRCDLEASPFDRLRVGEARRATARIAVAIFAYIQGKEPDSSSVEKVLAASTELRTGCDVTNAYCGSDWYTSAQEDLSGPFRLNVCGSSRPPSPPGSASGVLVALALVGVVWLRLRLGSTAVKVASLVFLLAICEPPRAVAQTAAGEDVKRTDFFDWTWNEQIVPTVKTAFDRKGLWLLGGGIAATVVAHQFDVDMRGEWRHRQRMRDQWVTTGSSWSGGFPGVAIALGQLVLDRESGILHARALALTSASHIAIALVAHRRRPGRDEFISFPSGHAASAFATATTLSYSYGWLAGIPAFTMAAVSVGSRLSDDAHWFSDVVAGAALGLFWGRAAGETKTSNFLRTAEFHPLIFEDGGGAMLVYAF